MDICESSADSAHIPGWLPASLSFAGFTLCSVTQQLERLVCACTSGRSSITHHLPCPVCAPEPLVTMLRRGLGAFRSTAFDDQCAKHCFFQPHWFFYCPLLSLALTSNGILFLGPSLRFCQPSAFMDFIFLGNPLFHLPSIQTNLAFSSRYPLTSCHPPSSGATLSIVFISSRAWMSRVQVLF